MIGKMFIVILIMFAVGMFLLTLKLFKHVQLQGKLFNDVIMQNERQMSAFQKQIHIQTEQIMLDRESVHLIEKVNEKVFCMKNQIEEMYGIVAVREHEDLLESINFVGSLEKKEKYIVEDLKLGENEHVEKQGND